MRVPLLSANWKMNKTVGETLDYAGVLLGLIEGAKKSSGTKAEMLICPTFTSLPALCSVFSEGAVKVGAQNMYWAQKGAFTGEISGSMIKELGCSYVIVGHSERRAIFGETDDMVKQKIRSALDVNLNPILCVGETLEQRQSGVAFDICGAMVREGLERVQASEVERIVVAYEPVWAIGTGKEAKPTDAEEMAEHIRSTIADLFGDAANEVRILYGGSVKSQNIRGFMQQSDIDGALIGGAALDPHEFYRIVTEAERAK